MAVNLHQIATSQERAVLRAFRESIQSVKDQAVIKEIVRLLEAGNVDGVIRLLQLDPATFEPIEEAIRTAYRTGGIIGAEQIGTMPTAVGSIRLNFDMRAPAAEAWLSELSSRLITEVFEEQRRMVRERLTDAQARGVNPRQSALDLVGRIDRRTGDRAGGFIGLTSRQAEWVARARIELEELDEKYLTRKLRDRRFDGMVRRAIDNGERLTNSQVNQAITQLQNRTLRYRGQVIARTESINALRSGQFESMRQAVDKGEVESRDIVKRWDATGDARTRLEHLQMEQSYNEGIPLEQAFVSPTGDRAMFPGDASLGADGSFLIQCRCRAEYQIDFVGRALRVEGFR